MWWLLTAASAGPWRVIETPHYRVHYPVEAEAFAERTASQLEGIRTLVAEEVGYLPEFTTQVVIRDPYGESNGMAIPLGRSPRVELWATPPPADSPIGFVDDWTVDLMLHEDVHVVHMLVPPRGLSGQLMLTLFGLGPVQVKAPRWALEGYATLLEGELTGAGRPNADVHATLLRQLARDGELPTYAELSWSERWMGRSFAYEVGAAFLQWLEERAGEGSARNLWARMSARRQRDFNQAFIGVYGERASTLYKRFCAELTVDALAHEVDDGTLWLDTNGSVGRPAVSPDGSRIAFVQRAVGRPATLAILETAIDEQAEQRRAERIERMLERDPGDVAPVEPATPPHATDRTWTNRTHVPRSPRWLDDDTLLFVATVADPQGTIRRDVFRWDLDRGSPRRLTHGGDIHRIDAAPGRIVGMASRWGHTRIVEIAPDGSTTDVITAQAPEVLDQPTLSPDGTQLAWLHNAGDGFEVWVDDGDQRQQIQLPDDWQVRQLAWGEQGLIASVGIDGRIDLIQLEPTPVALTRSGAAFAPEPAVDGLYHLQLHGRGYAIHKRPAEAPVYPIEPVEHGLAGRPDPIEAPSLPTERIHSRRMGLGRLEPRILVGGMVGAGSNFELGLRFGDIVGQNELAVVASLGDFSGTTGVGGWWGHRGRQLELSTRSWVLKDGDETEVDGGGAFELRGRTSGSAAVAELAGGAWAETTTAAGHIELAAAWVEPQGRWLSGTLGTHASYGIDRGQWNSLAQVGGSLQIGRVWFLRGELEAGVRSGAPHRLGGARSSIRAEAAQWGDLQLGWLSRGTDAAPSYDHLRATLGRNEIGIMLDRVRMHDSGDVRSYALAGVHLKQSLAREPLVRLPGLFVELGLGCAFERDGVVDRPCLDLEDYRAWSAITWTP